MTNEEAREALVVAMVWWNLFCIMAQNDGGD